ncbi:MAG: hypothetical protein CMO30_07630 [Tistrella sp.]|jgi:hypothetical protein|uniref:DUF3325 domain-containing protein n=1 Tax=Tistrella sp. TaxID=2024861 RepID=UPI000C41BE07|nr:DUF3325 domain-containing protein [Tistrella sp.]MAD35373.1 hypothetical protein [Tistrella sp.]MBA75139.1 hypothetical protein [Tistrella sp.]|tara:strand:- start:453 stop:803 length:351 start_codon:yes stop_codon:yes gene_type:complete
MIPLLLLLIIGTSAATALALAMPRHHEQAHGRGAVIRRQPVRRRLEGWGLVLIAAALAVFTDGWGRGLVLVAGVAGLAAPLAAGLFAWRPAWAGRVVVAGWLAVMAGLCGLVFGFA